MKALVFAFLMLFSGCGYYPVAHFVKKALSDNLYVALKVNSANTENSVEIKDLLNKLIVSRFQKNLVSKDDADTIITIEITSVTDSSIATNSDGFTTFYRASIRVCLLYTSDAADDSIRV